MQTKRNKNEPASITIKRKKDITWIVHGYLGKLFETNNYKVALAGYKEQKDNYGMAKLIKRTVTKEIIEEIEIRYEC